MALYAYSRGALFYEGSCLAEWQEGTCDLKGNFEAVETMAEGGSIRGFIRSEPRGMDVTFTTRIRADGTEFADLVDDWKNGATVSVSVWIGGKAFISQGVLNLGSISMKEGTIEATFMGAKPEIR